MPDPEKLAQEPQAALQHDDRGRKEFIMRRSAATIGILALSAVLAIRATQPPMAGRGRTMPNPILVSPLPPQTHLGDGSTPYCKIYNARGYCAVPVYHTQPGSVL